MLSELWGKVGEGGTRPMVGEGEGGMRAMVGEGRAEPNGW